MNIFYDRIKNKRKERIKMYEVTYQINGIIKKVAIKSDDAVQTQAIFTNMYGAGNVSIINVRRI